jgi:hypothetical protein
VTRRDLKPRMAVLSRTRSNLTNRPTELEHFGQELVATQLPPSDDVSTEAEKPHVTPSEDRYRATQRDDCNRLRQLVVL